MSNIYAVLSPLGRTVPALSNILDDEFPGPTRLRRVACRWAGRGYGAFAIALACCLVLMTLGCGSGLNVSDSVIRITPNAVDFGDVAVGQLVTTSISIANGSSAPMGISQLGMTGQSFSITNTDKLPLTIPAGGTQTISLGFTPVSDSDYSGQLTIAGTAARPLAQIPMHGRGWGNRHLSVSVAALSFGSVAVNTATTLPLTLTSTGTSPVTVNSASITGAGFTIVASSFPMTLNPTQAVTLQVQFQPTATGAASGQITIGSNSSRGSTAVIALSGSGTAANPQLTLSTASLSFGSVTVNTATTLPLTLTSTGTSPVTVNSASITAAGFTIVGGSFPVTLNPTQAVTLHVQFQPTAASAAAGQMTIGSNSSSGSKAVVALSGTGAAVPHEVDLSWDAPINSPSAVAGYNIYRSTGNGAFQLVNLSPDAQTAYVDNSVVSGASYGYYVKSVDNSGIESGPSNQISATIP